MPATRVRNIANMAFDHDSGDATASNGRWWAYLASDANGYVFCHVGHYSTHMLSIAEDGTVVPVSSGWGSVTDRQGINSILHHTDRVRARHAREGIVLHGYHELFNTQSWRDGVAMDARRVIRAEKKAAKQATQEALDVL